MISYEDPQSLLLKANYVQSNGLAGAMIWELSADDDQHTLLNILAGALPLGDNVPTGTLLNGTSTFAPTVFLGSDPWQDGLFDWDTLVQSKIPFVTHCPIDAEFIERSHALGIRCYPYVVFHVGSPEATLGPLCSDTYEGVQWVDQTDWYERDQSGNTRPWQFSPTTPDGVGITFSDPRVVCPNIEDFQLKMLAWVDYVMSQGADGVYIDMIEGRDPCWGENLHVHNHIIPDAPGNFPQLSNDPSANQNLAFALLLERVRQVVKQHRPDGIIIGNSGNPLCLPTPGFKHPAIPEFQQHLDVDTMEAYICYPDEGHIVQSTTWGGDPTLTWDALGRKLQVYLNERKHILVISDLGSSRGSREDALLCYASARLADLTWFGIYSPSQISMSDAQVADLYRLDLGKAITSELADSASGVNYRVFEHGLVAVNWSQAPATLVIQSPPIPATHFYDLSAYVTDNKTPSLPNIEVPPGGALSIPPVAGRVYLFGSGTDFGLGHAT
jgi:hypothetical protein